MLVEPMKLVGGPASDLAPAIPGLVWAFRLHNDGSAEPVPTDTPIELGHDGRLWLHFNLTDARARSWLAASDIPVLPRDLLLSKDNYQQLHTTDHCVYGVFSDLVRDIDAATEETGFLRFAMTEHLSRQRPASGAMLGRCHAPGARRWLPRRQRRLISWKRSSTRSPTRWTDDRQARPRRSTTSRNGFWPTTPSPEMRRNLGRLRRTCVQVASPAALACACCSTGSIRRTPIISSPALQQSTPASSRSASTASITTSLSSGNAAACCEEELRLRIEEQGN